MSWINNIMNYGQTPNNVNYAQPGGFSPVEVDAGDVVSKLLGPRFQGAGVATPPPGITDPTFMEGMTGYTNPDGTKVGGWGGLALSGLSTGANLFMGMKQYGLAKDSLKENKRQYDQNYVAQQKTTNAQMADRQAARVASNRNAYESVGSYMQRNGI